MKKYLILVILFSSTVFAQTDEVQNQPLRLNPVPANNMVRVVRWISPVTKDFESMPEGRQTDLQLQNRGFSTKMYQYSAYKAKSPGMIAVYRWTMPNCFSSILLGEHEHTDAQLHSWGYKDKEFQFYAYANKPATGDFVSVNRWINAKPDGDPCRDFTLSVVQTELTDAQLLSWGYKNKITQFWVPRPGSSSVGSSQSTVTGSPEASIQTIRLEDINEWLCPNRLTRGDREFGGHGPRIKSEVRLRIGDNGRSLYADITFWAQETEHDWSTAEGNWSRKVYEAPYGKKIIRIVSSRASRTQFISPPGGFQLLFPGNDVAKTVNGFLDGMGGSITNALFTLHGLPPNDYLGFSKLVSGSINNGNTAVRIPAVDGTLVKFFTIVGDTGGGDISDDDNCNDDTRIARIQFAPARIEMAVN